ncbi:MAG: DUF4837 family protein [Crocinitomicaceae bacterium]|nr:DUF4837 family protein [Crocinitomicaceae bacterium]
MLVRNFTFLILILSLITITSCESIRSDKDNLGLVATGKVGEVLVVCEQGIWDSEIKTHLDSGLTQFIMPYFPDVATFELSHRTIERFTGGYKRHRNTLMINIDPNYEGEKGIIEKRLDVWANQQIVIEMKGKDFNQILELCKKGIGSVHDEFDKKEWSRIAERFGRQRDGTVQSSIEKNFGISVEFPNGTKLLDAKKNFYNIELPVQSRPIDFVGSGSSDAGLMSTRIMIYQYDYIDSTQFDFKNLLMARDTMLKYNVPYFDIEGMYMGTQYAPMVYPEGTVSTSADGKVKGFEMRGMYLFTGRSKHAPGGGFWAFHFVNPKTKKLICVSSAMWAPPTTSWTQPLREIQAILKSVSFVE